MSSNFTIDKECVYCGKTFVAKTLYTLYCASKCNKAHLKQKKRQELVDQLLNKKTNQVSTISDNKQLEVPNKDVLSIAEACCYLGIGRTTLWRLIKNGKIKHTKMGRRTLIQKSDLLTTLKFLSK